VEEGARGIFESMACLQELNVSHNLITEAPQDISKLASLRILDLSKNQISRIDPNGLPNLRQLEDLILADNELSNLPEEMPCALACKNSTENNCCMELFLRLNQLITFLQPCVSLVS